MSDDLVARLRAQATVLAEDHPATPTWALDSLSEAAGRIEELTAECRDLTTRAEAAEEAHSEALAERDTLAEIVRLLDVSVEPCEEGETAWWLVTDNWFDYSLTPERGERFQRVLDRITKETSDDERAEPRQLRSDRTRLPLPGPRQQPRPSRAVAGRLVDQRQLPAARTQPNHSHHAQGGHIMQLTIDDLRALLTPSASTADPADPRPGDKLLIRTVTMTLTGRVVWCSPTWIVLDTAAWIADTGRFANAIANGTLDEVEPMGDGVRVARAAVVDITPWAHDLPTEQQ